MQYEAIFELREVLRDLHNADNAVGMYMACIDGDLQFFNGFNQKTVWKGRT